MSKKTVQTIAWLAMVTLALIDVANNELMSLPVISVGLTVCLLLILLTSIRRKRDDDTPRSSFSAKRMERICTAYFWGVNRGFWVLFVVMMLCHFTIGVAQWYFILVCISFGILIGTVFAHRCLDYLYNQESDDYGNYSN